MIEAAQQQTPAQTLRQNFIRRFGALDADYQTWRTRQMQVVQYLQPYRGRFEVTEANRGQRKDQSIINDTGIDAGLKLASAMSTGISSPVRKWASMKPSAVELEDDDEVKAYCEEWEEIIFKVCARSNFYNVLFQVYQDLVGPGTAAAYIEPDKEDVIRCVHFPVGSYRVAVGARGVVDTLMRPFTMTVGQIVEKFCTDQLTGKIDLSNVSTRVREAWENKRADTRIDVMHVIEPRALREYGPGNRHMPWCSTWIEWGGRTAVPGQFEDQLTFATPNQLLLDSGNPEQPFICGRWDVVGEDAYGQNSPGQLSVGDVISLQLLENSSAGLIATIGKPPMNVPPALANASLVPGSRNPIAATTGAQTFTPSYVPDPRAIAETRSEKERFEFRVRRAHFGDLLQLISNDQRSTPATAEEIRGRKEERLLQLGGVFQRFAAEVLTPAINRIFAICQRAGLGPPPPQQLVQAHIRYGHGITIAYENIFAQAQKAVGVSNLDSMASFSIELAKGGRPDALDSLNVDEMQRERADMMGIKPGLLNDSKTIANMRQQRAQAAQAQQQGQAMAQAAPAVQKLSQANPQNLRDLLNQFGPAAVAEGAGNGA